jgi:hypothetical protein
MTVKPDAPDRGDPERQYSRKYYFWKRYREMKNSPCSSIRIDLY